MPRNSLFIVETTLFKSTKSEQEGRFQTPGTIPSVTKKREGARTTAMLLVLTASLVREIARVPLPALSISGCGGI